MMWLRDSTWPLMSWKARDAFVVAAWGTLLVLTEERLITFRFCG